MTIPEDHLLDQALQKAFRFLAARGRSEKEIRSKLKEKGFDLPIIDRVVARLYELQYLDDESFARQWGEHLVVHKHFGNRRIEIALLEKGISRELARKVITELRQDHGEAATIRALIKKRKKPAIPMALAEKRRLSHLLIRKGFSPDLIYEILNRPEEDDVDDDG